MNIRGKIVISIFTGIFWGYILPHFVFNYFFTTSALSLIPWGIVGFILCLLAVNKRESIIMAQYYLCSLTTSFMFLGKLDFYNNLESILAFIMLLLVISAILGIVMGMITFSLKKILWSYLK